MTQNTRKTFNPGKDDAFRGILTEFFPSNWAWLREFRESAVFNLQHFILDGPFSVAKVSMRVNIAVAAAGHCSG
jgi:hypothetical protein